MYLVEMTVQYVIIVKTDHGLRHSWTIEQYGVVWRTHGNSGVNRPTRPPGVRLREQAKETRSGTKGAYPMTWIPSVNRL